LQANRKQGRIMVLVVGKEQDGVPDRVAAGEESSSG